MGGSHKGLEVVGGARIIDRVATALKSACSSIVLAANDPHASAWLQGTDVIPDRHVGSGGLAGVEAALTHSGDVLVVAWDMPFVTPDILRELARRASAHDADVVVPESDSPYGFEPFCAYYSARVLAPLTAFLDRGGGAAREFLTQLTRVHRIPLRDVSRLGNAAKMFYSVNTSEELTRARAIASNAD